MSRSKEPKISVIIPVYEVEKFIRRCVESLMCQTYSNLELLFVDDASPDCSVEIIQTYADTDSRIKIIKHKNNRGLFQARVTGMEAATGQYIAFVDSDDYVTCDWFRSLLYKIEQEHAEMVIGNTINEDEEGRRTYYNNYRSMTKSNQTLYGGAILAKLFEQEGSCFAWHTVWNKLYSKELVDRCMPYFHKIERHLIMGEDIVYGSIFFALANSLAFADVDGYFYYRHSEASTSLTLPKNKIKKNLEDIGFVFEYVEKNVREICGQSFDDIEQNFILFKERYFRTWSSNLVATGYSKEPEMVEVLCSAFGRKELEYTEPHEFYFYDMVTDWTGEYEHGKQLVASKEIKYVSFDVFDTLIKRAVYEPTDIFRLMTEHPVIKKQFYNTQAFYEKRILAEQIAREKLHVEKCNFEDVTLEEIYSSFCETFQLPKELGEKMQQIEEETEFKFCCQRESAKELFDLALHLGKTVFITSDMYLSEKVVRTILEKNGYKGYEKLYLSSEQRRLKATGNLFEYALKDLDIKDRSAVLHIGDTWNVDVLMAQKKGIKTFFMPKCREVFENKIPAYATNNLSAAFVRNTDTIYDHRSVMKQLPIRCMLAVVANKLFDNPFQKYLWETDYNSDSYHTGYYTLGMHMFGLVNWMYRICKKENYKTIHFLARDGKLAKQIFDDFLSVKQDDSIETDYFYATRKALLPYLIEKKEDFYDISQCIEIEKHTPEDILNMYSLVLKPLTESLKKEYLERGVFLDKKFSSHKDFVQFIHALLELSCDELLFGGGDKRICEAISRHFGDNEVAFDIGYSGRLQRILSRVARKPINVFYIHQDGCEAQKVADEDGFKIHSFYEFTPKISGIIREFFISEHAPSCVGYQVNELGVLEPILEEKEFRYQENYPLRKFQQGAYDFCKDMLSLFGQELDMFTLRPLEASAAFEYYLLNAKQCDRWVFSISEVEDDVYSGYSAKNLFEIWTWHQEQIERTVSIAVPEVVPSPEPIIAQTSESGLFGHACYPFLEGRSKVEKAWFYFWHDRSIFFEKFKFWIKIRKNVKG